MPQDIKQIPSNHIEPKYNNDKPKRKIWPYIFIVLILLAGSIIGILAIKGGYTFEQIHVNIPDEKYLKTEINNKTLKIDPNRKNLLILGMRGADDPNGGLLSDVNIILSIKKDTGQVALISIPRDLYLNMPNFNKKERINYAYALGEEKLPKQNGGIIYAKNVFETVSGLYIDDVIVINFKAFEEIINSLGEIDVFLNRPFVENQQFYGEAIIDLKAGQNHLNGIQALYYVRSRYTTSDFDRMRRQQQVLLAVKDKAVNLGVLSNPKTIFEILDSFGRNIKTTLTFDEVRNLLGIISKSGTGNINKKVLDTTPEGLLYEITNGAYHLLPVGDNFDKIHEAIRNIFN